MGSAGVIAPLCLPIYARKNVRAHEPPRRYLPMRGASVAVKAQDGPAAQRRGLDGHRITVEHH